MLCDCGEMAERTKAPVSKTGISSGIVGSNPTLSAIFRHETPDLLTVTTQYLPPCWPECPRIVHELFCWHENTMQAASFNYEGKVGKKRCWCDHLTALPVAFPAVCYHRPQVYA